MSVPPSKSHTAEQARAIATRGVTVALDAGAGCGKTFVLTERYLSHLAPGADGADPAAAEELVAITFTDAAAREMRDRIRSACRDRLRQATAAGDAVQADWWLGLLRGLDAARVSTFHSFCGDLVRAHAIELGLDPGFRLLDQSVAALTQNEATEETLRGALDAEEPDALELAAEMGIGVLRGALGDLVDHAGHPAFVAWTQRDPGAVVAAWRAWAQRSAVPGFQAWRSAPEVAELLALLGEARPTDRSAPRLDAVRAFLEEAMAPNASPTLVERAPQVLGVKGVCTAKDWPTKEQYERYKKLCEKLRKNADQRVQLAPEDVLLTTARMGLALGRLARRVAQAYEALKRERAALDFDDLLRQAHRLLTDAQFSGIQQRLRDGVRMVLVDEFQDTDSLQLEIVQALVGGDPASGRLFLVGDFKQSIYRFRGAEPHVFRKLRESIPAGGRLPLSGNFRSQPGVLKFVNALFAPVFGGAYVPLRAQRPAVAPGPAVEFLWTPAPQDGKVEAARRAEARAIARRVRALLEDPTPRVAQRDGPPRRVEAGDVAVLMRVLSDAPLYEGALRDEGVPYLLIGGHAFYAQQEVYDVLNLVRSVVSGCDEVALAGVLRSPFFALEDETLHWLRQAAGGLAAGLFADRPPRGLSPEQSGCVARARDVLLELRSLKGAIGVGALLERALELTGYDAALGAEFLGERQRANLGKLVAQARTLDETRPGDADAFARQLFEFTTRPPKEALAPSAELEGTVVRVMTVHHAKGLEFPVVVLPDLDRVPRNPTAPSAFSEELGPLCRAPAAMRDSGDVGLNLHVRDQEAEDLAELDRLFYVACTRAADLLVLSSSTSTPLQARGPWLSRIAERFDLETGVLMGETEPRLVSVVGPGRSHWSPPANAARHDLALLAAGAAESPHVDPGLARRVMPLPLDPLRFRRFSVSRITGRLHRPAPEGADGPPGAHGATDGYDPREFGVLVHAVLERWDPARPDDLGAWCAGLAPLRVRRHADQAAADAELLVRRYADSEVQARTARAAVLRREVEFLLPWDQGPRGAWLEGYIDCLYQTADGSWRVLDYKTNQVSAADAAALAESYKLQMYVYALAVERATGAPPKELELLFMRPGVVHTFPWDEAARLEAHGMIDAAIAATRAGLAGDAEGGPG